jgi:hypothetical protein
VIKTSGSGGLSHFGFKKIQGPSVVITPLFQRPAPGKPTPKGAAKSLKRKALGEDSENEFEASSDDDDDDDDDDGQEGDAGAGAPRERARGASASAADLESAVGESCAAEGDVLIESDGEWLRGRVVHAHLNGLQVRFEQDGSIILIPKNEVCRNLTFCPFEQIIPSRLLLRQSRSLLKAPLCLWSAALQGGQSHQETERHPVGASNGASR